MAKKTDPPKIGRYEIRRELGRGVMGVVYQAWDPALGRTIALKTIKPVADSAAEREAWETRFLTEARAAARLSHSAIVVVHDVGRDSDTGVLYIALEYLEGETLAEKIGPGRPLPWQEAFRIVSRVARALHHAHGQGVVHRDIKPANIMILRSGEPKILDFGIARLDAGALTNPGDLFGTPLFMSPEQAAGHDLDARSDIFSLGAVAWALLTGRSPFEATSVPTILARVIHRHPAPPSALVPSIPSQVDLIVARAMAKAPEERYPDGRCFAEDVEDALAGRPPRHRAEWSPRRTGERTLASVASDDTALPSLELRGDHPPAGSTPTRRRGLRLVLVLLLLASAGTYLHQHPNDRSFWAIHVTRALSQLRAAVSLHSKSVPALGRSSHFDAGGRLDAPPISLGASASVSPAVDAGSLAPLPAATAAPAANIPSSSPATSSATPEPGAR